MLLDPKGFHDRLKQSSDINSKSNNSFHFQRDGAGWVLKITAIVSSHTKSLPEPKKTVGQSEKSCEYS